MFLIIFWPKNNFGLSDRKFSQDHDGIIGGKLSLKENQTPLPNFGTWDFDAILESTFWNVTIPIFS